MIFADCPACFGGKHDKHIGNWGTRPKGIIDGEFCPCKGDCEERAKERFDKMFPPLNPPADFSIGSPVWPGLAKTVEETSELNTVIAKLMATGGKSDYFDGRNLRQELQDELADVMAAVSFVNFINGLDNDYIMNRSKQKLSLFIEWHYQ